MQPTETKRLDFLDVLRGIAALAVALQHIGAALFSDARDFTATYLQLGQFGVSVFFLCSGFVIPISIERRNSLGRFWWHRLFRLYPLYWASLAVATYLAVRGMPIEQNGFADNLLPNLVANLTMLQNWAGFPHAIGVYWSLGFEMVFYGLFSALLLIGWNKKTPLIVGALLSLSLLFPILFLALGKRPLVGTTFHFATMFFGTLIYRHFQGAVTTATLRNFLWATLALIIGVNFISLHLHPEFADTEGVRRFLPMTSAWLAAYSLFFSFYMMRNKKMPAPLAYLGRISYSVYLIHPIIIAVGPKFETPAFTLIAWMLLTIGLSHITFTLIEKPFIRFAHSLGKRRISI